MSSLTEFQETDESNDKIIKANTGQHVEQILKGLKENKTKIEEFRANFYPILFSFSFFLLLLMLVYTIAQSYDWQFERVWPHIVSYSKENGLVFGVLFTSLGVTLKLVFASLISALFLGLLLAGMNLSASPVAHLIAQSLVGIVRNTPLLMQLYLVYFVFAPIFSLTPFSAAVIALALFEGTYIAEIFRAGFRSISHTQWEAGFSLGFSTMQSARIIVLPQAIQNVLPSLIGQIVSLIKDTSLVSAIAVADLTMRASELISETYLSFEIWIIVALFYLVLTSSVSIPLAFFAKRKNKNMKRQ